MNVYIFDIDSTVADNSHREHLLREYCVRCGGAACFVHSNWIHRPFKICASCDGDEFVIPPKSWEEFTEPELMVLDAPIVGAQNFIKRLQEQKQPVHYITGRQERCREATERWLRVHFDYDYFTNQLLMRPTVPYSEASKRQHLPASQYKDRSFQRLRELEDFGSKGLLFHFFDDDPHVLSMYKRYGLTYQAPQCWEVIDPAPPRGNEKLFSE